MKNESYPTLSQVKGVQRGRGVAKYATPLSLCTLFTLVATTEHGMEACSGLYDVKF